MKIAAVDPDRIIAEVDAIYVDGPPPRTTVSVPAGAPALFLVNGLFLECTSCGIRIPQSRTRRSPPARALWLRFHLQCVRAEVGS